MQTGSLLTRIRCAEQVAKDQSKYSPECLCFPTDEPPFFGTPFEMEMRPN